MRLRSKEENRVRQIPLVQICPGKAQPRKNFSNEELLELARSIQENGVLQPLTVRKAGLAGFELIAGTVTAVTGFYIDLRLIDKHDQTSL